MSTVRLKPDIRNNEILMAAMKIAGRPGGYSKLTRLSVAAGAGCSEGLVSKYYGTMTQMRRAVMRRAIETKNLSIIAQGLAINDKWAKNSPPELKREALNTLSS